MQSLLASDAGLVLQSEADALTLLSSGLPGCVFTAADLHPDFFELRNGVAGQILQKLVNYRYPVALVVSSDHPYGPRVTELIRDHRHHPCVRFFQSIDDANMWLRDVIQD